MNDIPLTVLPIAGTGDDMITWQALAGVGSYRLMRDGKWVSSSYNGAKTTWRVKRGQSYLLRAYGAVVAEGEYPAPQPVFGGALPGRIGQSAGLRTFAVGDTIDSATPGVVNDGEAGTFVDGERIL